MAYSASGQLIWLLVAVTICGSTPTDALTAVRVSGYFNDAADMMNVGDVIFVYDSDAPTMGISVVLSNTGNVVDIADGTALTVSDSD